jgi:tRNA(adenine34) deaminase
MEALYEKFMREALIEAQESLSAGEFPVGCVLAADGEIVSRGRRINSCGRVLTELDHAEIVALRNLDAPGAAARKNLVVYCTMEPCLMCYSTLLLNGVRTVVYGYEDVMGGGLSLAFDCLSPLYRQMKPEVIPNVLRNESLNLVQQFFRNPSNRYWEDSLLARYTLQQEVKGGSTSQL